jgi:hypothetical protein
VVLGIGVEVDNKGAVAAPLLLVETGVCIIKAGGAQLTSTKPHVKKPVREKIKKFVFFPKGAFLRWDIIFAFPINSHSILCLQTIKQGIDRIATCRLCLFTKHDPEELI